jgi:PAS domain S-box-containing protein
MTEPTAQKSAAATGAFRIVVYYALFGSAWILFSDLLLDLLLDDQHLLTHISLIKGWLFIGITSILLAILIRRKIRVLEATLHTMRTVESQLRNTIELAVDGIFFGDREGRFIGVNSQACDLVGYSREELLGKRMDELFPPQELQRAPLRYDLLNAGMTVTTERQVQRKDGSCLSVEMRSKRMPDGTYQSFMRDVSERRRMEQALLESEERFRTLFECVPCIPVQGYDRQRRVIFWNGASEAFYGYAKDEAIGRQLEDLIIPLPMRDEVIKAVTDWVEHGVPIPSGELLLRKKDGSPAPVYSSHVMLVNTNGEPEMYCIDLDLGDRKRIEAEIMHLNEKLEQLVADRTEELRTALQQMESFSYSISHDLRAPLRAIDGFVQILQDECAESLDPGCRQHLERISRNARHMGALIDDLLLFSRLGRQPINRQPLDLDTLVSGVLEDYATEIRQRGIEVRVSPLPACEADAPLIRQVFANLVENAVKFTAKTDTPRIEIGSSEEKGAIVYFVRDNGAGFDMAFSSKLFGVFQRLHSQQEFDGTGVGLAIVRNIIQRHGGQVRAEATVGAGATFSFTIPA